MPDYNIPLLERVMTYINDHPEQHEQSEFIAGRGTTSEWGCGTVACFAGWTSLFTYNELGLEHFGRVSAFFSCGPTTPQDFRAFLREQGWQEDTVGASVIAQYVLGLSNSDTGILYSCINTRAMLDLMVKDLTNGEPLATSHGHYARRVYDTWQEWAQAWVAEGPDRLIGHHPWLDYWKTESETFHA